MKKLILFLIIVLTLTSYAIADVYLYSGNNIISSGTDITIDSATATTNFNGNTTAGISGWGTITISTTSIVTATSNNYGIYINKNNETLTIYGEEKEGGEEEIVF